MVLEWNVAMTSGVKEIDEAHKILINGINELAGAMKSGHGRVKILKTLDFLIKYAHMHFAHEESCMDRYHCPAAHANKCAHDDFIVIFSRMKKNIELYGPTEASVTELHTHLTRWWKNHIMKIDRSLAEYVNAPITEDQPTR